MTLRNTSGKFSLSHFGRKPSQSESPSSSYGVGNDEDREREGGSGGSAFDGLGKKLGKSLAHTSLLPALGNSDLRVLQDVITSEKGVLQMNEKLAVETQKAALALPAYGTSEGPDLADVLAHSSTLLTHLSTAYLVFSSHQAVMRGCYKRIREREEELDELRRRRRSTGQKAESAEKKLAKMGPESKALPGQADLLEKLRAEMRQMDTDIMTGETKLGDFKRVTLKEALSLKFGGLEELGEKMCIIGELGKLLLEEIPLEETPAGYGRAPYGGYEKTASAANEATKCLATVHFNAPTITSRPPGLPHHTQTGPLQGPGFDRHDPSIISAAEEYGTLPQGLGSPGSDMGKGKSRGFGDDEGAYGGIRNTVYGGIATGNGSNGHTTGHVHGDGGHVVWAEPSDAILGAGPMSHEREGVHDYEYEQQMEMDAQRELEGENVGEGSAAVAHKRSTMLENEERAWREDAASQPLEVFAENTPADAHNPPVEPSSGGRETPSSRYRKPVPAVYADDAEGRKSWEPLKINRDRSLSPNSAGLGQAPLSDVGAYQPPTLDQDRYGDIALGAPLPVSATESRHIPSPVITSIPPVSYDHYTTPSVTPPAVTSPAVASPAVSAIPTTSSFRAPNPNSPTSIKLPTAPFASDFPSPGMTGSATPRNEGFYTPLEGPASGSGMLGAGEKEAVGGTVVPTGGKMTAAAFRKGVKPRGSLENSSQFMGQTLSHSQSSMGYDGSVPGGLGSTGVQGAQELKTDLLAGNQQDGRPHDSMDFTGRASPPPVYRGDEDLR